MLGSNLRKAKENAYLKVLMGIEMFATLSTSERTLLLKKFKEVAYSEGEVIVQQGEVERNFYILMRGTANVHLRNKPADGESEIPGFLSLDSQKKVTTLQAGAYFGEDALLKDVPRTATIVAGKRATCFVLTSAAFLSIVGSPKDYSSRNEVHRNELVMITGQSMERKIPKKELPWHACVEEQLSPDVCWFYAEQERKGHVSYSRCHQREICMRVEKISERALR